MEKVQSAKKPKNILLKIALFVFIVYIVGLLINVQAQIRDKRAAYNAVQEQIASEKANNERLLSVMETDDEEYIERIARERLGYAKPGDRVFVDISGK